MALAKSNIVVDQTGKIERPPDKKEKSGSPDNNKANGEIHHFRLAAFNTFALVPRNSNIGDLGKVRRWSP